MPIQVRIAAIVAAAVMTATIHHRYIVTQIEQRSFVATTKSFQVGQKPQLRDLTQISLGGDVALLSKVLVPWEERAMIVDNPVLRDFTAGELLIRRDVEVRVISPYQPRKDEYVFVVDIPDSVGLRSSFQIGSAVGFLLENQGSDSNAARIEECGPFIVRQFGAISRQVDPRIMQHLGTSSVTLSLTMSANGQHRANAQKLLSALSGGNESRLVGLYHPRTKG